MFPAYTNWYIVIGCWGTSSCSYEKQQTHNRFNWKDKRILHVVQNSKGVKKNQFQFQSLTFPTPPGFSAGARQAEAFEYDSREIAKHGLGVITAAIFLAGEMAGSGVLALPAAMIGTGKYPKTYIRTYIKVYQVSSKYLSFFSKFIISKMNLIKCTYTM